MNDLFFENSAELWRFICKSANFKDVFYDYSLQEALKKELKLSPLKTVEYSLKQKGITCDELVLALLRVMEPYSQMMVDLLKMFERASAQSTDNNIQISFDFENKTNNLTFDLKNFKRQIKIVTSTYIKLIVPKIEKPFELVEFFYGLLFGKCCQYCAKYIYPNEWLDIYFNKDVWPNINLEQPKTGIYEFDKLICKIWLFINAIISEFKITYDEKIGRKRSVNRGSSDGRMQNFWCAENDLWIGNLLNSIFLLVDAINNLQDEEKKKKIQLLTKQISKKLDSYESQKIIVKDDILSIIEVLNIPIWKKRYELYSAWVATQIVAAFEKDKLVFNVTNNTLSFSFKGSRLATAKNFNPPLEIWSELRTPFSNPVSKKRKNNIQPDYTIGFSPVTVPENSIAVIECKQYKKSSTKNFSEAITDYANGRPYADVYLVNYGSISSKVIKNVSEQTKERTCVIGEFVPSSIFANVLKERISETVTKVYNKNARKYAMTIELKWDSSVQDLDLIVEVVCKSEKYTIYYEKMGHIDIFPYAILNRDFCAENGVEIISLERIMEDATYNILVINSSENSMNSIPELKINIFDKPIIIKPNNPLLVNDTWNVCKIDSMGIEIINSIESRNYSCLPEKSRTI